MRTIISSVAGKNKLTGEEKMKKTGKVLLSLLAALALVSSAWARNNEKPLAVPYGDGSFEPTFVSMLTDRSLDAPGDPVDWGTALIAGGDYMKHMQADVTEDNAGNGSGGSESPNDPDDAGWDWVVTSPPAPFFHTTGASPTNLYGVSALGLYYAYVKNGYTTAHPWFVAMTDAADRAVAAGTADIRSAADIKFLMLYNDLPDVAGTSFKDAAKAKYDWRITNLGSGTATGFAEYIRDVRGITQNYPNGIIGWDIGAYVVAAQMLHDRFPGDGYDTDADEMAEVLWQDSFNDSPGLFDVDDDDGWDPTFTNKNYWWYTLGVTGLLDAFRASGSHTGEIPGLVLRLQASQYSNGAFSGSYGANGPGTPDEDWQATSYAVVALNALNPVTYATEIAHGTYWTAATQQLASGGWVYGNDSHYPAVGGENLSAMSLGGPADEVWVDDDWTNQADVDGSPYAGLVWGYDAFGDIQTAINNVGNSTVNVLNGTYYTTLNIYQDLTLIGESESGVVINASAFNDYGIDAAGDYDFAFQTFTLDGPDAAVVGNYGLKVSGDNATVSIANVTVIGTGKTGIDLNGLASGTLTNCTSTGALSGNGLSMTDCDNITINGLTTSGNAWGGAAVYTKGEYATGGSDNVTFMGTLSLSEARPIYWERDLYMAVRPPITNLTVPIGQFPYVAGAANYPYLEAYQTSQANAVAAAVFVGANGWAYERAGDFFYVELPMKIQAPVTAAGSTYSLEATGKEIHVAAGTYTESVNVNNYVKIIGEETILASLTTVTSSTGPVFTIAASGLNAGSPLLFQDLQVLPVGQYGFNVPTGSYSYIKLDNVHVIGNNPNNALENEVGLKVATYASLSDLEIVDCSFDHLIYGWYFAKHGDWGPGGSMVSNVTVTGTSFSDNDAKGIYVEKLSDATFADCEVNDNGLCTACYNDTWNAGFDINLKGVETYQNIAVNYCDFEGNAIGKGQGMAVGFKARGSGTDGGGSGAYQLNPASLSNVSMNNCKVVGNERGVRIGEPGQANTLPANSVINECAVYGNANGDFVNATTASQNAVGNWWGSATPSFGTQVVGTGVTYTPWLGVDGTYPDPGFEALTGGITMSLEDPFIGCVNTSPCNENLLHITTDQAGLVNLQVVIELPANFELIDPTNGLALPVGTVDDSVIFAVVNAYVGTDSFEVNIIWAPPYSSGNTSERIASIPIKYTGSTTGTYTINGLSSLYNDGMNYIANALALGSVDIDVDCSKPTITDFSNSASCTAFGSFAQMVEELHGTFDKGVGAGASDLDEAWVQFGIAGPTLTVFTANTSTSPYTVDFPGALWPTAWYTNLNLDNCTDLYLYVKDVKCNVSDPEMITVGRDETPPTLGGLPVALGCYSPNTYLALDNDLNITDLLNATPCGATIEPVKIWITGETDTLTVPVPFANANWPWDDTDATALWTWITTMSGVPGGADGETYTFNVRHCDCAGNCDASTFSMCIDLTAPGIGAVTTFDARPADAGVWLNWAWTPDAAQAVEMRIYRSPITPNGTPPAGYPGYTPALRDVYDVSSVPPTGWTLVATQLFGSGEVSSATETNSNNRGDFALHGSSWLDAEGGWAAGLTIPLGVIESPDALGWRDIYRYVTFVKDAGGNWSTGYATTPETNVDHSTNYWLGDFSPADAGGFDNSRGRVDTDDLNLLSAVYFTSQAPADYRNIGPTIVENGNIGKGIPTPDPAATINFFDLVPFSFNYGMVSPVGTFATEFSIQPDPTVIRPFNRLDEAPVVSLGMETDPALAVGSEFTVMVTLTGNEGRVVKAVEARLSFDEAALEVIGTTDGSAVTAEGTLFAKVSAVGGEAGQIGFVAASCGGWTTLDGNAVLGTVTFRVKAEMTTGCDISLESVSMFDNAGEIIEIEGETITLLGTPAVPENYALYQNYPNPFNPTTNIQFDLKEAGQVKIMVYNTLGQIVATVADRSLDAGSHTVAFDASSLASGVYVYTINVNDFSDLKKMVLIR